MGVTVTVVTHSKGMLFPSCFYSDIGLCYIGGHVILLKWCPVSIKMIVFIVIYLPVVMYRGGRMFHWDD